MTKTESDTCTSTALAVVSPDDGISNIALFTPGDLQMRPRTTIDVRTPGGQALVSRCQNDCCKQLGELIGQEITVRHVYVKPVEFPNEETGEVITGLRIVLVSPADELYECYSSGIWQSLIDAAATWGQPPWHEGLVCKVVQRNLKSKNRMYRLMPLRLLNGADNEHLLS